MLLHIDDNYLSYMKSFIKFVQENADWNEPGLPRDMWAFSCYLAFQTDAAIKRRQFFMNYFFFLDKVFWLWLWQKLTQRKKDPKIIKFRPDNESNV